MQIAWLRGTMGLVAFGEFAWSALYYFRPDLALGFLGRTVLDPVMARQYPLYLASAALAYALAASDPIRFRAIVWACVAQRAVELTASAFDWRAHAIASSAFAVGAALEIGVALVLTLALRGGAADARRPPAKDPRDRGLIRMLRGFGGLELFWFFASTIFVQVGSRLLNWKLQDPYTTQQQGIALLAIGLASLVAASDVARYRVFVLVPIASQLIGIVNSINEIRLGSIGLNVAAVQWTIESTIVAAFVYLMRHRLFVTAAAPALAD